MTKKDETVTESVTEAQTPQAEVDAWRDERDRRYVREFAYARAQELAISRGALKYTEHEDIIAAAEKIALYISYGILPAEDAVAAHDVPVVA